MVSIRIAEQVELLLGQTVNLPWYWNLGATDPVCDPVLRGGKAGSY